MAKPRLYMKYGAWFAMITEHGLTRLAYGRSPREAFENLNI